MEDYRIGLIVLAAGVVLGLLIGYIITSPVNAKDKDRKIRY